MAPLSTSSAWIVASSGSCTLVTRSASSPLVNHTKMVRWAGCVAVASLASHPLSLVHTAMAAFIFQQLPPSAHEVKARADATTTRDILDSYDIKEELGSGSYAVVRRAVNKTTGESVAVKVMVVVCVWREGGRTPPAFSHITRSAPTPPSDH